MIPAAIERGGSMLLHAVPHAVQQAVLFANRPRVLRADALAFAALIADTVPGRWHAQAVCAASGDVCTYEDYLDACERAGLFDPADPDGLRVWTAENWLPVLLREDRADRASVLLIVLLLDLRADRLGTNADAISAAVRAHARTVHARPMRGAA